MQKLDIINELRHIQEVSRTSSNVLTSIIRQLEKDKTSQHSDNSSFIQDCLKEFDDIIAKYHIEEDLSKLRKRLEQS